MSRFAIYPIPPCSLALVLVVADCSIRRINQGNRQPNTTSFLSIATSPLPSTSSPSSEDIVELLPLVTTSLPGQWNFSTGVIHDADNVRFFQKTRVFALQQYIRLLIGRHMFGQAVEGGMVASEAVEGVVDRKISVAGEGKS
jgi:hypothetical protein